MKVEIFNNKIKITFDGCDCGKYRAIKYLGLGIVCDRCGIEAKRNRKISFDRNDWSLADFKEIIYKKRKQNALSNLL